MYHEAHYHSTTHEGLAVFRGNARMRFGVSDDDNTDDGVEITVKTGDVIVIPAGVAHCALKESGEFSMVGSYPEVLSYLIYHVDARVLRSGICVMEETRTSVHIRKKSQRLPRQTLIPSRDLTDL